MTTEELLKAPIYTCTAAERALLKRVQDAPNARGRECSDYAAAVGLDMWRAGIQECLKLAKEHLYAEERGNGVMGWEELEAELEKL